MRSKDYKGASDRNISDSLVNNPTSFFNRSSHVDRCSPDRESQPVQPGSPSLGALARRNAVRQVNIIHNARSITKHLGTRKGLSEDVVDVIMSSWRPSTHKQYTVYVNKWLYFCDQQQINPMHPSVTWVCKFLHSLFMNGLSYSVFNTARLVISNLDLEAILNSAVSQLANIP